MAMRVYFQRVFILISFAVSPCAWATGYEKPILWSGRFAGIGNAATAIVRNSEATVLNPAGLAEVQGTRAVLDLSPVWAINIAPVSQNDLLIRSSKLVPVAAAFVSHRVNGRLGVGAGLSAVGGVGGDFGMVDFGYASPALVKTSLSDIEVSFAAGYRLAEGLNFGAAWRITILGGELDSAGNGLASSITDFHGYDFSGYRLGLQYQSRDKKWGLGAVFRSAIDWVFKNGNQTLSSLSANPPTIVASSQDAKLTTSLPYQLLFGGYFCPAEAWLVALEYDFTNYSDVQTSTLTSSALSAIGVPYGQQQIQLNWRNFSEVRVGIEHGDRERWPLRVGYVFGSQVTPNDRASYSSVAPGASNTLVIGTGKALCEKLIFDGAFDVSLARGVGTANPPNLAGQYTTLAYSIHGAVEYRF